MSKTHRFYNIDEYGLRGTCKDLTSKEEVMKCVEQAFAKFEENEESLKKHEDHEDYRKTLRTVHFYLRKGAENEVSLCHYGYGCSSIIESDSKENTITEISK